VSSDHACRHIETLNILDCVEVVDDKSGKFLSSVWTS